MRGLYIHEGIGGRRVLRDEGHRGDPGIQILYQGRYRADEKDGSKEPADHVYRRRAEVHLHHTEQRRAAGGGKSRRCRESEINYKLPFNKSIQSGGPAGQSVSGTDCSLNPQRSGIGGKDYLK